MPGVIVSCICGAEARDFPRRVLTNPEGRFKFLALQSGRDCSLRAEVHGYATVVVGPIRLVAGRSHRQEILLTPSAETTQVVVVEAQGAIVDTESATSTTTLNQEYIEALPIVGRSFQDLLTLAPGVTDVDGDGNPNVRGSRDTGLQYRLDGADITDPLTGQFGQVLNLDAIEEVEIITAGAPAEYSRADGGFANVVTRSGGNDFEGSIRLFFRTRLLDNDGSESNDFFYRAVPRSVEFRDIKGAYSFGGPIRRESLWYFLSVQSMDIQTPQTAGTGTAWTVDNRGYQGFAKLTWQVNSDHRLSLQSTFDPQRWEGLGLRAGVLSESDYIARLGGVTTTLRWITILSPVVMMETALSHFDSGNSIDPVSDAFEPMELQVRQTQIGTRLLPVALYPCNQRNCDRAIGPTNLYQQDLENNIVSGPFWFQNDDSRIRDSLRTAFTISLEDLLGSHTVKTGFEFKRERFTDEAILNPVLTSSLRPGRSPGSRNPNPLAVQGFQNLFAYDSIRAEFDASGGGLDFYLQDLWKPAPNLSLSLGARVDREEVESSGIEYFPVRGQARRALRRFDLACELAGSVCTSTRIVGKPSGGMPARIPIPPGHPLERFDLQQDGYFDSGVDQDGVAIWGLYTRPEERRGEVFTIINTNIAPRFAVSWDPLSNGKTRISWTWGRYYDRLFLGTVTAEQIPDQRVYTFTPGPDPTPWISPGDLSGPGSPPSIVLVQRDLETPYKDEWSFSLEREIAPEWSAKLMLYSTRMHRQLQDQDLNHITCADYGHVMGVPPSEVCGDGGVLEMDRFGSLVEGVYVPNGIVDLYNLNPEFNQIFRIGNLNSSSYRSFEIVLNRRLYHGWQIQLSYVLSKTKGDAESFLSFLGDDPARVDDEAGYLDFDQRHVVKALTTFQLPRGVTLGATAHWSSGTPFSVIAQVNDADDAGNFGNRIAFVTGQRNDQRNGGSWTLSGRLQKGFTIGNTVMDTFLAVENILNSDDLSLRQKNVNSDSFQLTGLRREFGRRWELGTAVHF